MNPQIGFLLNKALESLRDSNLESAELYLKQALRLQSNNPHVLRLLGVIAAQRKQYPEALGYLNTALKFLPKNSLTLSNLGNIFLDLKEYNKALEVYDKSIKIDPKYEEVWSNKGNVLFGLKRFEEALVHHDKALSLKPDYAEAWSNKGNTLNELKRHEEAIAHYDKALSLKPDYAEAWSNKGNTLNELKRHEEAIAHYDKALSLKPDYSEAWSNKGSALNELKRYEEAIAQYERALSLKPDIDWLYGDFFHTKMKVCLWNGHQEEVKNFTSTIDSHQKIIKPFALLSLSDNTFLHGQCCEIYVKDKCPFNPLLGPIPKSTQREKIRIGYFSADFHNHATGYLMAELFELHEKSQFELIGFSFGPIQNDEMRERLVRSFDQFVEVGGKSDVEIAQLSRNLNIDIAVDLKGFTQDSRTGIFAYRAAPIQVNYLGYPGTMGAEYIDYIIADKTLIPTQSQQFYSEKVAYLPDSYQTNDRKRVISDKQFTRHELGLPDQGFVFCCFNNNFKILPETFASWMRILNVVEGSVIWLFQDNPWAVENLKKEALNHGVDASRLIFADRMLLAEHLARHQQADLFIDTFPYNAHTTASDALWAGLPVLTLIGQSFASRVAASLLNAVGLPELITDTKEGYEAMAIELAAEPEKLAAIKQKLQENRNITPLFDTPLFTKNLEAAYIKMMERYQADLQPDHVFVA